MVGRAYVILHEREEKIVKYRTPKGKEVCLTRELYLRRDISCRSGACSLPECQTEGLLLDKELDSYIIVDGFYALNYWELFELEEIKGLIITLSTANYVQQQGSTKRPYNRIRSSIDDPVQSCVIFDNEFHQSCFRPQSFNESARDYTTRMNWIVSHWYHNHFNSKKNVIFVTDNRDYALSCAAKTTPFESDDSGVLVMDLHTLLQTYYPNLTTARLLLDSLDASLNSKAISSSDPGPDVSMDGMEDDLKNTDELPSAPASGQFYPAHLPESALLAGLRSGQFLRGILRVSRYRPTSEAMVALTDASAIKHQPELKEALAARSEIMVHGLQHRNRAMDGDTVVIRLLPRSHWKAVSSNITATEHCAAEVVQTSCGVAENTKDDLPVNLDLTANTLPCGFIVGIANRNWRDYVCSYITNASNNEPISDSGWIIVTPWDRRVPRIRLHTTQASKLSKERFVVRIDSWDAGSTYPHGHFVNSLGRIGDLETETQTLLIEHNLAIRAFSEAQLAELAPLSAQRPWKVDPEEVKRRRDLRSPLISGNPKSEDVLIFSIDPPGCQDVDDTLSVEWLPPVLSEDGTEHKRIRLGVHIADVTFFVPAGGYVDMEARRRSTSIYLADRRYDMLPGILSGDVCSLWSGVDRYAVSVIWEIDMDTFDVLDVWYGRTVIRSSYKLTYEIAQRIYDAGHANSEKSQSPVNLVIENLGGLDEVKKLIPELNNLDKDSLINSMSKLHAAIDLLATVASNIRTRRIAKGGLELESVEVTVKFSNPETRSGQLEDLVPKEPLEMHSTVAELMIFANHWVARRCLEAFPDRSCLRRHPPPRPEFFDELQRCVASRGFALDTESNRSVSLSLAVAEDPKDPEVNKVIRQLVTRAMTNALYFSTGTTSLTREQFSHYGLALNLYTHFTSPIRRYADVIVHRVLLAALCESRPHSLNSTTHDRVTRLSTQSQSYVDIFTPEELSKICSHMNEQHWSAQQVQRASMELFQCLFFKERPEEDPLRFTDAIICQLRGSNGFVVLVPRFGIRGVVCVKDHKGMVAWADKTSKGLVKWVSAGEQFEVTRVYPNKSNDCGYLEVRNRQTDELQSYHIFDHVTVKISVTDSTAHGLGLRLDLFARPVTDMVKEDELTKDSTSVKQCVTSSIPDADMTTTVIEAVHTNDVKRRLKHTLEEEKCDLIVEQSELIAQLHEPTSLYHRFHKLLRQSKPDDFNPS